MPEMTFVNSSHVEAVGYDPTERQLYIRFLDGSTYVYQEVDEHKFAEIMSGGSVGTYLNQHIKKQHTFHKL